MRLGPDAGGLRGRRGLREAVDAAALHVDRAVEFGPHEFLVLEGAAEPLGQDAVQRPGRFAEVGAGLLVSELWSPATLRAE